MLSSRHRPGWAAVACLVIALALAAVPGAPVAATPDGQLPTPSAAQPSAGTLVTLVTGDRVLVSRAGTGEQAITVEPAPRTGFEPSFQASTHDGQTYVIPSDVAGLVPQVLDRELFNVTKLAAHGHDDGVPVIMSRSGTATARTASATGLAVTTTLPSIDAVAAVVAPDGRWWRSLQSAAPAAGRRATSTGLSGVERVWLDDQVEVALAESVPLVGAAAAWDAGYDGTGMTVAVLDTGIDAGHPDLAGKVVAAQNFSTFSDTTADRHGHGTHVAGIVAGSGAAAGGGYVGVAPGAALLNGKVLGDDGFGQVSDIIAGMQWAVGQGADVVNMSLGGDPTDGTDPLSQAVNQLTAEHDVLFVIAAGNHLPADHTISAPGAADAALTVGSVDKDEQLAFDSGRGPRLGDFALKPDLTAPGVGIVSARAEGTALGPIVDEHYTRISGTSMAAPHVAGAAALLRQQDPDLSAAALKAALTGSAVPHADLDVYQQGGGRLDIAAAVAAPVRSAPASLSLGHFPFPQDDAEPVDAEVTYSNRTDQPVTLDLSLAVQRRAGGGGAPPEPPPGKDATAAELSAPPLSVSPATLTIPAGGSATATVQLDVRTGDAGLYGGYMVAASNGVPVTRTAVGFHKEPETYQLTIEGIARDGRPAAGSSAVNIMDVRDATQFLQTLVRYDGGVVTVRVPAGTYSVLGVTYTYGADPRVEQERVFVGDPEVEVTEDTHLVLDARQANPVVIETPEHQDAAPMQRSHMSHWRGAAERGGHSLDYVGPVMPEYAVATDPVTLGEFEYYTRWRIGAPPLALRVANPAGPELSPWEVDGSPRVTGEQLLPLVDAGAGAPEDYQGIDATGAIVLTTRGGPDEAAKAAAAHAAGAAALVVANHEAGNFRGFVGKQAPLPLMTLSQAEGETLRELLDGGPVTLRLAGEPASPYLYDLVLPEPGQVPAELRYPIRTAELATLVNTYHSGAEGHQFGEARHFFRPWADGSFAVVLGLDVPLVRTEYLVPGGDNRYRQIIGSGGGLTGMAEEPLATYQAGEHREQGWFKPANRPGFIDGGPLDGDFPAIRSGNVLTLTMPEWVDAHGRYGARAPGFDTVRSRLYADGDLIAEATRSSGQFRVEPAPARYRFEVDVSRAAPWWTTSTASRTAWTFTSAEVPGPAALPLLTVDVDLPVDPRNTAPAGPLPVGLRVRHQPGATGPAIESTRLWVSYDDGQSWEPVAVGALEAGRYRAELAAPPEPGGYASLRVEAVDEAGNRFEQELIRAWQVGDVACDRVLSGRQSGPLRVAAGVTCLAAGTQLTGPVHVGPGAGLVAAGARLLGPLTTIRASRLELRGGTVTGPVSVIGTNGPVTIADNQLAGPVNLTGNRTGDAPLLLSGNTIAGPLSCTGNQPPPVDNGVPNTVTGPRSGQCRS